MHGSGSLVRRQFSQSPQYHARLNQGTLTIICLVSLRSDAELVVTISAFFVTCQIFLSSSELVMALQDCSFEMRLLADISSEMLKDWVQYWTKINLKIKYFSSGKFWRYPLLSIDPEFCQTCYYIILGEW